MRKRNSYRGEPCPHYPNKFKTEAAHIGNLESKKRHYEKMGKERAAKRFASDLYPLRLRLQRLLCTIRMRCRERPRYAGRGIQNFLTYDHLLFMWQRDGAGQMKRPSIDRRDNDGNYYFANCRFIELADNIRHGVQVREAIHRQPGAA